MKKDDLQTEQNKHLMEGRTVIAVVITVTAFLCFFTVFEIFAIKMQLDIPAISMFISVAEKDISVELQETEKLEVATETVGEETLIPEKVEQTEVAESTEEIPEAEQETVTETELEEAFPYYLKINRRQNVVTVYETDENGEYTVPLKAILCSTGLNNATPKGVFHLSDKYIWAQLNGGVYGQYASRITGGILFHSVPYVSKNKDTLYWDKYNKLGQHASMGCVRLTVEDAKWIYENCPSGTTVEVYESEEPGPLGKPETLKLDKDNANKGWDPTDPDENNPWHEWSQDS